MEADVGYGNAIVRTRREQMAVEQNRVSGVAAIAYVLRESVGQAGHILVLLWKCGVSGL